MSSDPDEEEDEDSPSSSISNTLFDCFDLSIVFSTETPPYSIENPASNIEPFRVEKRSIGYEMGGGLEMENNGRRRRGKEEEQSKEKKEKERGGNSEEGG